MEKSKIKNSKEMIDIKKIKIIDKFTIILSSNELFKFLPPMIIFSEMESKKIW